MKAKKKKQSDSSPNKNGFTTPTAADIRVGKPAQPAGRRNRGRGR